MKLGKKKKKRIEEEKDMGSVPTLIGADSMFEGVFKGKDSICIQGQFKGRLQSEGNVYINQQSRVEAEIQAQYIAVHGEVLGNVVAREELNVGPTGRITGDVHTKSLTVATGGFLDGCCQMQNLQKDFDPQEKGLAREAEPAGKQQDHPLEPSQENLQQSMEEFLEEESFAAEEQQESKAGAGMG
ncbi:MAG: polymer-forming cytoskeletal protein [Desulfohalobiaceae bacterium]